MRDNIKKIKIAIIILAVLVALATSALVWFTLFSGESSIGSASSQDNMIAVQENSN